MSRAVIRVAHSSHGAANAVMSLGIEAGIFAAHAIDVVMVDVRRTSDAVQLVASQDCDIAMAGAVPILRAANDGVDLVIIMSAEGHNAFAVMGAPGIDRPEQLRGRAVGVSGKADQDYSVMVRALRDWGFRPGNDVELRVLPSRGDLWDALLEGEIAAMCSTNPQPILAEALGVPILRDFRTEEEPFQCGCLVTTRQTLDRRSEVIRRLVVAQAAAVRHFETDVSGALKHLRLRAKIDREDVLLRTHGVFSEAMSQFVPQQEALDAVKKTLESASGVHLRIDTSKLLEPAFAIQARESLDT